MLSIGSLIREKVEASGMTVKEFSERLGIMRPNVYRIFSAQSIDTALLWQICVILNCNFFEFYAKSLQDSQKGKLQN
jgi:transcriptional regulator with XRE-family HTH domain